MIAQSAATDYHAEVTGVRYQPGFALVLAVLAVTISCRDREAAPLQTATQMVPGGTEFRLLSPLGSVEQVREFAWASPLRADRYRVIVRLGPDVVWEVETSDLKVAPPLNVFVRDVEYRWQVQALDREGHVRLTSPSQPFTAY